MSQIEKRGPLVLTDGSEGWVGGDTVALAIRPIRGFVGDDSPGKFKFPPEPLWQWLVKFSARTREGVPLLVGEVQFPMMGINTGQGWRIVAAAYCPGAINWTVQFESFSTYRLQEGPRSLGIPAPIIDVQLTASSVASQSTASAKRAFAWTVRADGIDDEKSPENYPIVASSLMSLDFPADCVTSPGGIVLPGPRWVARHWGSFIGEGAPYLLQFDNDSIPTNGTAPQDVIVANTEPHWERRPNQEFYLGFVLAPSSTSNVLTSVAGANVITVKERQRKKVA